jgi:hypothetical protein
MSKFLYYIYLSIAIIGLISTVLSALWWRSEIVDKTNVLTPVEPIFFTLLSFVVMIYCLNKIHLFFD